jgi:hypothetical protein
VVIVLNWFWWGAERAAAGGSAVGGYIIDGRYFLGGSGSYTEVTQAAWIWSLVHAVVSLVSFVIFMGIIILVRVPRATLDYGWMFRGAGPTSPSEAEMDDTPHREAIVNPDPASRNATPEGGPHTDRRLLDHPPRR